MQKLEDCANPGRDARSAMNVSDANDSKREGQASNFAIGGALAVGPKALVIAVVALEKEPPSQEQCAFGGVDSRTMRPAAPARRSSVSTLATETEVGSLTAISRRKNLD
jgi:hypothetical protein